MLAPFRVAVTDAVVELVTEAVFRVADPDEEPAGMVRVDGRITTELLLVLKATVVGEAAAAARLTVTVELCPPVTEDGDRVIALRAGDEVGGLMVRFAEVIELPTAAVIVAVV